MQNVLAQHELQQIPSWEKLLSSIKIISDANSVQAYKLGVTVCL